jgi:hypothetical protein
LIKSEYYDKGQLNDLGHLSDNFPDNNSSSQQLRMGMTLEELAAQVS